MTTSSRTSRRSSPPLWLIEGLDLLRRRRVALLSVIVGVVLVGVVIAVVAPGVLPPRAVVGAAVGFAAILLGIAVAVGLDATDPMIRGPRHVQAAGGEVVAILPDEASTDDARGLAGSVQDARQHGGPLLLGMAAAGRDPGGTLAWTDALAAALAEDGRSVLRIDLATGWSEPPGLAEVVNDGVKLTRAVDFDREIKLAWLGAGRSQAEALSALRDLPSRLPRDLDVLLVALPTAASRKVLQSVISLEHVLVVAERDRTPRVDLIAGLNALGSVGVRAQVVLLDDPTARAVGLGDSAADERAASPPRDPGLATEDAPSHGGIPTSGEAPARDETPPAEAVPARDEGPADASPVPRPVDVRHDEVPSASGTPADPDVPAEPEPTAAPGVPAEAGVPAEPRAQAEPGVPAEPETPAAPEPVAESDAAAVPEAPAAPEPVAPPPETAPTTPDGSAWRAHAPDAPASTEAPMAGPPDAPDVPASTATPMARPPDAPDVSASTETPMAGRNDDASTSEPTAADPPETDVSSVFGGSGTRPRRSDRHAGSQRRRRRRDREDDASPPEPTYSTIRLIPGSAGGGTSPSTPSTPAEPPSSAPSPAGDGVPPDLEGAPSGPRAPSVLDAAAEANAIVHTEVEPSASDDTAPAPAAGAPDPAAGAPDPAAGAPDHAAGAPAPDAGAPTSVDPVDAAEPARSADAADPAGTERDDPTDELPRVTSPFDPQEHSPSDPQGHSTSDPQDDDALRTTAQLAILAEDLELREDDEVAAEATQGDTRQGERPR